MTPILIPLFIHVTGCSPYPDGLRLTPDGSGPTVVIDWDAKPLPEIPLPNDLATRPDPSSVTGLRLNISEEAPTEMERDARRKINGLAGFGIYAPFTVSFDRPLDLDEIQHRQQDDGNFADDAFLLINVEPSSPDYLQPGWTSVTDAFRKTWTRRTGISRTTRDKTVPPCSSRLLTKTGIVTASSIREKTPTMTASSTFRTSGRGR